MKDEIWKQAEFLTQKEFNLKPTSGSGRGYDKLDAKDNFFRVDTKSQDISKYKSYGINFGEFKDMRLQATKDRKQFFLHVVPYDDKGLKPEDSFVVFPFKLGKSVVNCYRSVGELLKLAQEMYEDLYEGIQAPNLLDYSNRLEKIKEII